MAACTIERECIAMIVGMAGNTIRTQPEISIFLLSDLRVGNVFCVMALCAVQVSMCTCEWVSREVVIKAVNVETDDLKVASMMFAVALDTVLTPHPGRDVKPPAGVNSFPEFCVAVEAFVIGYFIAESMALCAVGQTFQMGVRISQVARRDLSRRNDRAK